MLLKLNSVSLPSIDYATKPNSLRAISLLDYLSYVDEIWNEENPFL